MKNVAIIGAGLQGGRRLPAIAADHRVKVSMIVDRVPERAVALAKKYGGTVSAKWHEATKNPNIDCVLVLTYPDSHAEIAIAAMQAGKDVLCEKPLARTVQAARRMVRVAERTKRILKCGFNHRHHPAILKAYQLFKKGEIGKPVFGRGICGIAGREGLEKEWRSDPAIVGGGQLMEQGVHLIDLFRWFLGDIATATGITVNTHWSIEPLEDNGFALCTTRQGVPVSIHASLTQWVNLFQFEIYGANGSITVAGLGGSYGTEKLIVSKHDPQGPFSHHTIEYRGSDVSWENEWQEFMKAVRTRKQPLGNGRDGLAAMSIVNAVYTSSKTGKTIRLRS